MLKMHRPFYGVNDREPDEYWPSAVKIDGPVDPNLTRMGINLAN